MISRAACKPGHARHRDVEDRQVDVLGESPLDRFGSVARLPDDLEVGLLVEHPHQPAEHDGMVVGDAGRAS